MPSTFLEKKRTQNLETLYTIYSLLRTKIQNPKCRNTRFRNTKCNEAQNNFSLYIPGLSSYRYSVIFSADSEIFAFSAMFIVVPADFNFYTSGDNWFSDEHFWTSLIKRWTLPASAANSQKPWKQPKKCFFFNIDAEKREIENFRTAFNGFFWKILKVWFFRNLYFLLMTHQKTSY